LVGFGAHINSASIQEAISCLLMPMAQINSPLFSVAVPPLAVSLTRPERYRASYLRVLEKIAMVTMPASSS